MTSSLSKLVNNLSEGIHRIKCKFGHDEKNVKHVKLNRSIATAFLNAQIWFDKDALVEYKCLRWNSNYQHKFDEKLKERFFNTYKFSNHNDDKFILLLWKVVYHSKYMNDW